MRGKCNTAYPHDINLQILASRLSSFPVRLNYDQGSARVENRAEEQLHRAFPNNNKQPSHDEITKEY